jgi:hypothetical protein
LNHCNGLEKRQFQSIVIDLRIAIEEVDMLDKGKCE